MDQGSFIGMPSFEFVYGMVLNRTEQIGVQGSMNFNNLPVEPYFAENILYNFFRCLLVVNNSIRNGAQRRIEGPIELCENSFITFPYSFPNQYRLHHFNEIQRSGLALNPNKPATGYALQMK